MAHTCRCRQLLAITTFYVANTALSLGGLSKLNVPMYTTLKRLTPIFVLGTKVGPYSQVLPGVTRCDGSCPSSCSSQGDVLRRI